jgi:hypothetical protein
VRVVINGQTIRPHANDDIQSRIEAVSVLVRQSVDEVEGDRLELRIASCIDEGDNLIRRLHAIDGFLDSRVEVLDTEAQAIEAEV